MFSSNGAIVQEQQKVKASLTRGVEVILAHLPAENTSCSSALPSSVWVACHCVILTCIKENRTKFTEDVAFPTPPPPARSWLSAGDSVDDNAWCGSPGPGAALSQWSPAFLTPGTRFMEEFFHKPGLFDSSILRLSCCCWSDRRLSSGGN